MNFQNFNQSGGFPIKTQTLDEMQSAYRLFNDFSNLAGNFAIVLGCVVTGAVVSNGAVTINGELLEFRGGQIGTNVIIVEEATPKEFKNGDAKNVLFVRYATFGVATTSYLWSNFKRPKNTIELTEDKAEQTTIDLLIKRIVALEARPAANVPVGLVALWVLPFNTIPPGWVEHVPLRGRMAVGLNPDDADFDSLGTAGGAKTVTLLKENLPSEEIRGVINGSTFNAGIVKTAGSVTENTAAAVAINIMNPYRIVHYIKYTG